MNLFEILTIGFNFATLTLIVRREWRDRLASRQRLTAEGLKAVDLDGRRRAAAGNRRAS